MYKLKANYIDIFNRNTFAAEIVIENKKIKSIVPIKEVVENYILPGFVDAHIHIESSMLVPSEFAKIAVTHGTIGTVSDPHEIANVCGIDGVYYMIDNAKKVPLKFNFGAPSCVPATSFETSGAVIDAEDVKKLLANKNIKYLSEMMNFPGVLLGDKEVIQKIEYAKQCQKPIDGHAPGLLGEEAIKYINAGISTDHECTTYEEALHKLHAGMNILIREGSAAKNFNALIDLLPLHYNYMMFCCDDKHPDELLLHHINFHVKRALLKGYDIYSVLQVACVNPVLHYKLDIGLLRENDPADFIIINNTTDFTILQTYINGDCVFKNGTVLFETQTEKIINNFNCTVKQLNEIELLYNNEDAIPVINALDGQLITNTSFEKPKVVNNKIISDIEHDILKIVVVNRYSNERPAIAFIKNIGLLRGAIASTVAHDCHNIIAVGTNDDEILFAINTLIQCKGGICATYKNEMEILPLPVGGIMGTDDAKTIAEKYSLVDKKAKSLGTKLSAPFMTLSFMALLVIPEIKLSDKGLWNGKEWKFY